VLKTSTFLTICWLCIFRIAPAETGSNANSSINVVSEAWPPYIVVNDKVAIGLEVDIAREVFRQLSINMTFSEVPWKRAVLTVQEKHADAILGIFSNVERRDYFYYPDESLLETTYAVFSRVDESVSYQSINDLSGLRVAITRGYFYSQEFSDATDFKKVEVTNVKQSFGMLSLGRVDVVIENRDVGNYYADLLNIKDNIFVAKQTLTKPKPHYLAFAMTERNKELVMRFSDTLKKFKQTPDYQRLLKKYGR